MILKCFGRNTKWLPNIRAWICRSVKSGCVRWFIWRSICVRTDASRLECCSLRQNFSFCSGICDLGRCSFSVLVSPSRLPLFYIDLRPLLTPKFVVSTFKVLPGHDAQPSISQFFTRTWHFDCAADADIRSGSCPTTSRHHASHNGSRLCREGGSGLCSVQCRAQ